MELIFSRLFWGIFIIVIGLAFVLSAVTNIKLPIGRILLSLLFIYIGVSMLIGAFSNRSSEGSKGETTNIFQSAEVRVNAETLSKEYTAIFGSQTIHLEDLQLDRDHNVEINSIFGSTRVIVPAHINVRVKASAVFGSAQLPDGNSAVFGDNTYIHKGDTNSTHMLYIEGNAVFGGFELVVRN